MNKLPRDNKGNVKCTGCGGYGYWFPAGQKSAAKCDACGGDGISRKPGHVSIKPVDVSDLI